MSGEDRFERVLIVGNASSVKRARLDASRIASVTVVESLAAALARQSSEAFDRVIVDPGALEGPEIQVIAGGGLTFAGNGSGVGAAESPAARAELLETIFNAAGTLIAYLDREFRFVMANDAYVASSGHSREELIGRDHFELFPNAENEEIFRLARDTGETVEFRAKPFEYADQPWRGTTYWDWILVPVRGADGEVAGLVFSLADVTEIKRAEAELLEANERLRILSETAGELLSSDQPQVIVESLCRRVMEHLGCDLFVNYLVVEERDCLHLNAYAGIPEEKAKEIEWLEHGVAVCGCVAQSGERIVAEEIGHSDDPRVALVREMGIGAYACHPLLSHGGKVVGTLSFGSRDRQSFAEDELSLMKTVADQVSSAMERIRLTESAARSAAELRSFIASMADGVLLLDGTGEVLFANEEALRILDAPPGEDLRDWLMRCRFYTMSGRPMARVETASARALRGETTRDVRYRLETPTDVSVVMGVSASPVISPDGRVIGSVTIFRDMSERFELEKRRDEIYAREHHIADMLQQALIPPATPRRIGGYRFAMAYKAAMEEASVGGDFYDVFEMGEGRIGVLIGDVTGKGLKAAMRVSAARYSIRSYAYLDPRPGRVLTLANRALYRDDPEEGSMLTAFFAVIDSRVGIMTYSNAGHEPPIVLRGEGDCRFIILPGLPMGITDKVNYEEESVRLDPGDRVLLLTDGITEARCVGSELFGTHGVLEALKGLGGATIEELASGILEAAKDFANRTLHDDAAVLAVEQSDEPGAGRNGAGG